MKISHQLEPLTQKLSLRFCNLLHFPLLVYTLNLVKQKKKYLSLLCCQSMPSFLHLKYNVIVTLKCLSFGTPKIINFPFVSNGKLMVFRCPNIQAHCNEAVLCLNFGTPENNEFSIWDKWKIYYL